MQGFTVLYLLDNVADGFPIGRHSLGSHVDTVF